MGFLGDMWDTLWSIDPIFSIMVYSTVYGLFTYNKFVSFVGILIATFIYTGMYYWRARRLSKTIKKDLGFIGVLKYGFYTSIPVILYIVACFICNLPFITMITPVRIACFIASGSIGNLVWGALSYYLVYAPMFYQGIIEK